jgi:hypothetical protein
VKKYGVKDQEIWLNLEYQIGRVKVKTKIWVENAIFRCR